MNMTFTPQLEELHEMDFETYIRAYMDQSADLIDGKVYQEMSVSEDHDDLTAFLTMFFKAYGELTGDCKTRHDKFTMRLSRKNAPEPDVLVVAKANFHRLTRTYVDGPADLVIEVVSPESIERDTETKFKLYETYEVPEYWLVDPLTKTAQFYILDDNGVYQARLPNEDGIYQSPFFTQIKLPVAILHQRPVAGVLQAVAVVNDMLGRGA